MSSVNSTDRNESKTQADGIQMDDSRALFQEPIIVVRPGSTDLCGDGKTDCPAPCTPNGQASGHRRDDDAAQQPHQEKGSRRIDEDTSPKELNPADCHENDLYDLGEMFEGVQFMLEGRMGGLAEHEITKLAKERDQLREQATKLADCVEVLEKWLALKSAASQTNDGRLVTHLKHLERESQRLSAENCDLKKELQNIKRENPLMFESNEGKSRNLRGAHKKAKNARDAASKEEEKAKNAVYERSVRLESERKMRKELKAAKADVAQKEKAIEGLCSNCTLSSLAEPICEGMERRPMRRRWRFPFTSKFEATTS